MSNLIVFASINCSLGWLSPELYLRRPPAKNESYRLDRMLEAAAKRGVKVNIIVYKVSKNASPQFIFMLIKSQEVAQALTRKYLTPILPQYLASLIPKTSWPINLLSQLGLGLTFASLEKIERENPILKSPISVDSEYTKHYLEKLHPNIAVFRHPDHAPDAKVLQSSFLSNLQKLSLDAATVTKLPGDALKALYGVNEDIILYWAHHEKLCLIDGKLAFMGGLDLCL
jgi:phospholipase D1/2